jgi:hypothetical protein
LTRTWGGSAIGGDIVLELTPSFFFNFNQRAPKQQISRCLEDGTMIDLSMSEISDEEVDYGSYASNANSVIAPDSSWSAL